MTVLPKIWNSNPETATIVVDGSSNGLIASFSLVRSILRMVLRISDVLSSRQTGFILDSDTLFRTVAG